MQKNVYPRQHHNNSVSLPFAFSKVGSILLISGSLAFFTVRIFRIETDFLFVRTAASVLLLMALLFTTLAQNKNNDELVDFIMTKASGFAYIFSLALAISFVLLPGMSCYFHSTEIALSMIFVYRLAYIFQRNFYE